MYNVFEYMEAPVFNLFQAFLRHCSLWAFCEAWTLIAIKGRRRMLEHADVDKLASRVYHALLRSISEHTIILYDSIGSQPFFFSSLPHPTACLVE
jgi:hypothetical protein